MAKLLVPTDGSDNALRAVRHVVSLAGQGMPVEVVLVNVQRPVMSGEVGQVAPIEIAEDQRALAAGSAIAKARALLDAAKLPVSVHEAIGNPAEEIARAAEELRCDGIVMGHRGLGMLRSLVMGSVSEHVIRLAKVPVTLVK
ncbi:MAG TPA: universal stress protein [Usitatibacter sp.]|nr:universal stress protein [Usitatibacter sp.]